MKCGICSRKLGQPDDPLSTDCGGDCWGCIGEIEADVGDLESLRKVREEFEQRLRPHDGFVLRRSHDKVPPRVDYSLTPTGMEMAQHVEALTDWIEGNMPRIGASSQDDIGVVSGSGRRAIR